MLDRVSKVFLTVAVAAGMTILSGQSQQPAQNWKDRAEYDREASASRSAGERFLRNLDAAEMERFLLALPPVHTSGAPSATIESLSPEKRALLLERLRKRRN